MTLYRVQYLWHFLNREIFDSKMKEPEIRLEALDEDEEDCYGCVYWRRGTESIDEMFINVARCKTHKTLLEVIVHEMAHQHQKEVQKLDGTGEMTREGGHGDSFWVFKDKIKEKVGIRLC